MPTLNWIGKDAVVKHHKDVPFRLLEPVPSLSCGEAESGNLIVQGDNLLALKAIFLPLEFKPSIVRPILTLAVHRRNGELVDVPVVCRLDTAEEVSICEAGGLVQQFAQDFLETIKSVR